MDRGHHLEKKKKGPGREKAVFATYQRLNPKDHVRCTLAKLRFFDPENVRKIKK